MCPSAAPPRRQPREYNASVDLQTRLIAPCAEPVPQQKAVTLGAAALLRRLLLFDTYLMQTIRFREFVPLVRILGVEKVVLLLGSGALRLQFDPTVVAQDGQSGILPAKLGRPSLPLLSYSFASVHPTHYNELVVGCLSALRAELVGTISRREVARLEEAILKALVPRPEESGYPALDGLKADLRANSPILRQALRLQMRRVKGLELAETELMLKVSETAEGDFAADTNLVKIGLTLEEAHSLIEGAMLAVAYLNRRIEEMQTFSALSGSIDDELPLFSGKFEFLAHLLSPESEERTFERVLKIRALPSFEFPPLDSSFPMSRFLEVRASPECREFRVWLSSSRTATDREISDQVNTLRERLSPFVQSSLGKALRIVVSTGVGSIPGVGSALGLALSLVDSFLVEKVFPARGPTLFLSRLYPSLFRHGRAVQT